jgi:class 3 adenylate cyclase
MSLMWEISAKTQTHAAGNLLLPWPHSPPPNEASMTQFPESGSGRAAGRSRRTMQGERRTVTVLFCDVAGSTAMAEQLDPEDWAEIMNDAFGYLTGPVERYGGTVARLMGDAVLAEQIWPGAQPLKPRDLASRS